MANNARRAATNVGHSALSCRTLCRFTPGWDDALLAQLQQCTTTSAKPILSTYPPGYTRPDQVGATVVDAVVVIVLLLGCTMRFHPMLNEQVPDLDTTAATVMCATGFGDDKLPRFTGGWLQWLWGGLGGQRCPIASHVCTCCQADRWTYHPLSQCRRCSGLQVCSVPSFVDSMLRCTVCADSVRTVGCAGACVTRVQLLVFAAVRRGAVRPVVAVPIFRCVWFWRVCCRVTCGGADGQTGRQIVVFCGVLAGEEIAFLARAWTHGWDVFAPSAPILFHLWSRAHRPTFRCVLSPLERAQVGCVAHIFRFLFPCCRRVCRGACAPCVNLVCTLFCP